VGDLLELAARAVLAPLLKEEGFRKRGLTWNRSDGNFVDIINIQKSAYGTRDDVSFTVNFSLASPPDDPRKFVSEMCGVRRLRIGSLMGSELDHWWKLPGITKESAEGALRQVAEIVKAQGFDLFEQWRRPEHLAESVAQLRARLAISETYYESFPEFAKFDATVERMLGNLENRVVRSER